MSEALARDFGSVQRWRTEFSAMGYALGGGSGWVLLSWMPRDGRLINQYASEHSQAIASGIPVLALDMYEHAYHIDFGANATAYVDTFLRNVDWQAVEGPLRGREARWRRRGRWCRRSSATCRASASRRCRAMLAEGKPLQLIDTRPKHFVSRQQDIAEGVTWRDPERVRRMDGRALEGGAGSGVLRLRVSRRLPHGDCVARSGLRRPLHDRRPLRLEGGRWADEDASMIL